MAQLRGNLTPNLCRTSLARYRWTMPALRRNKIVRPNLHVAEASCRVRMPTWHAVIALGVIVVCGCFAAARRHHSEVLNSLPTQHAESASKICSSSGSKKII